MYKYILDSVQSIDWLAIVPLVIFFFFFCMITYRALREKKSHIQKMERLPLED